MRAVLGFFSMLALGLMIAAVLVVAPTGFVNEPAEAIPLDYMSVVVGLGIGVIIAILATVSWSEVARRVGTWLLGYAKTLWLIGWAAVFIAILVYY
jgi:hypothetical protein